MHTNMKHCGTKQVCLFPHTLSLCALRYFKSHTLLVEQRLEKEKLPEVVRESDAALRYDRRARLTGSQHMIGRNDRCHQTLDVNQV